ncbi:MFS general substrate transporter [Gloeopeniophorella convolvens]|nr:MFS general substrate transporter [Gloeopeniophorella convolvens]
MNLPSEKGDEKNDHVVSVGSAQVDTAAQLVAGVSSPLDPEVALRIRRKIDKHILPLMCGMYQVNSARVIDLSLQSGILQFMDKATLGNSVALGIQKSTDLKQNQYNWLGTIFFLSYLIFQFPQGLALQRFPVGKWLSINIFVWGVVLCCHAACKNFAGLFVVRFILGACEGSVTAGFMIISSMFYTRREYTARVGYWCKSFPDLYVDFVSLLDSLIVSGFISYGCLHIRTPGFEPWQWLMVITGGITVIVSVLFYFFFPDSPTNAWFLSTDERVKALQRVKENQTGVENKHFKKEQMIEALTEPKTWLFALLSALSNVPSSFTNQRQIIVSAFGFNPFQVTLLTCVDGVVEGLVVLVTTLLVSHIPNSRAWVGMASYIPSLLGLFLVNLLPFSDKVGLLFSIWLSEFAIAGITLGIAWASQTTSGHTKRITTNAIVLSAYCIGNAAGPFMWRTKYKPRFHIPWIIIAVCFATCIGLLFIIRLLLARENKRRDGETPDDTYDDVYIVKIMDDGQHVEAKVPKGFLDLTDRQNRDFRYVL